MPTKWAAREARVLHFAVIESPEKMIFQFLFAQQKDAIDPQQAKIDSSQVSGYKIWCFLLTLVRNAGQLWRIWEIISYIA